MAETDFLQTFIEAAPPVRIRMAAARRLLPIAPAQALALLVHLLRDPEPEVAETAHQSLGNVDEKEVLVAVSSRDCPVPVLEHYAAPGNSSAVLEAIVVNPATPGPVVAVLAEHAPPELLELILYNRVRLLENPEIVRGIRRNPVVTREVERTVQEIEQEYSGERKQRYTVEGGRVEEAPPPEPVEDGLELDLDDLVLEGLPVEPGAREKALGERLAVMTVRQKARLAVLGNREARALLIRDPNREVSQAVLKSPKLSESEVESFASMRNVSEDILREIGSTKEWTRSYNVVHSLVRNPKTPVMVSQRIMFRLMTKDLANLTRDRGVPEAVRRTAQSTLAHRTPGTSR